MEESEKDALYEKLGDNIRDAREQQGLKQGVFAQLLDLSRASVVNIEKARQHPPLHLIVDMAKILKKPLLELIPEEITSNGFKLDKKLKSAIKSQVKKIDGDPKVVEKITDTVEAFINDLKPKS